MSFITALHASASGLTAQRVRMDVISNNLANVDTTRTPEGGPYRRQQVLFSSLLPGHAAGSSAADALDGAAGVNVARITEDPAVRVVHDPSHPDADAQGNVRYPDIDTTAEMVDMLSASRAYEANITAFNAAKSMALKAIDMGR
jgi:flagellar basal-body rod protein FlgC